MQKQPEKEAWIALACSPNPVNRKLALELADSIKGQIQDELLYWFFDTDHFQMRMIIHELLDEEHRKIVDEWFNLKTFSPKNINYRKILCFCEATNDPIAKRTIIELGGQGYYMDSSFLCFIKKYKNYARTGLKETVSVMEPIRAAGKALMKQKNIK